MRAATATSRGRTRRAERPRRAIIVSQLLQRRWSRAAATHSVYARARGKRTCSVWDLSLCCCPYFTGFLLSQNGWLRTVTDLTTYLTTISSFKNCVGFGGLRLEAYELVSAARTCRGRRSIRAADCATTAQHCWCPRLARFLARTRHWKAARQPCSPNAGRAPRGRITEPCDLYCCSSSVA